MNVQEFQNKLKEVQEIAKQNDNTLTAAEIRAVFDGCDLDKSQLLGVLKYLTSQGIVIEGMENAGDNAKEPEKKKIPLTEEEKAYYKQYLDKAIFEEGEDFQQTTYITKLNSNNINVENEIKEALWIKSDYENIGIVCNPTLKLKIIPDLIKDGYLEEQ